MEKKINLNKFKGIMGQLKVKQHELKQLVNNEILQDAKKYAEKSSKEFKLLIKNTDMQKVKAFISKETKDLQKLQRELPAELAKLREYVNTQVHTFENMLKTLNGFEVADKTIIKIKQKMGARKKATVISKNASVPVKVKKSKVQTSTSIKEEE